MSPLTEGEKVSAVELADVDICQHEIFVRIKFGIE